ncbi:MAG: hypothetical protein HYY78_23215 [Betaproteobacteria bacterium]|nr:hypothetical protein [Betaproteobacteria bacterium]
MRLLAQSWLEHAEPGLLGETLAPLKQKLAAIFILKHGPRVEVLAPAALRREVAARPIVSRAFAGTSGSRIAA